MLTNADKIEMISVDWGKLLDGGVLMQLGDGVAEPDSFGPGDGPPPFHRATSPINNVGPRIKDRPPPS